MYAEVLGFAVFSSLSNILLQVREPFIPVLRQPDRFSGGHLHDRKHLARLRDERTVLWPPDFKRAPEPRALEFFQVGDGSGLENCIFRFLQLGLNWLISHSQFICTD
jgi:hypothetical protein